eukprot:GFUD01027900.1.p1 GENE.GFUD01027900.1~~GFUD01027900.1.p1  ORF type:complete len:158 (-),score=9.90 GFUD01027900.1:164-637(-)
MRYESSFRSGRSLSPDLISKRYGYRSLSIPPTSSDYELPSFTCMKDGSFSEHVDHLINRSRANSEVRSSDPYFREFPHLASSNDDLHYSSLLSNSLTPWSKTGAFYYPRYPESWRGTAASIPALRREYFYWTNPARYYRHRTYYPRYYPRYRSRYYR